MKKSRSSTRCGPLVTAVFLFAVSGGLRLFLSAEEVLAASDAVDGVQSISNIDEDNNSLTGQELDAVVKALNERESAIEKKELQLLKKSRALEVIKEKIDKEIAIMKKAESELRMTIALADSAAENDIKKLVAVYENMKPKNAALLFDRMDHNFSAGFLGEMNPASAASIIELMSPETAYAVSAVLAGRNAAVPTTKSLSGSAEVDQ